MAKLWAALAVVVALGAVAGAKDMVPRDGDYLSEAYLAALDKTRSHYKAFEASGMEAAQAIRVSRDKRGLVLSLCYNWHEGDEAVFDAKNLAHQIDASEFHKMTLTPVDATHFAFKDGDRPPVSYRLIGDEQRFLMAALLVGTYADTQGSPYVFSPEGKARFPGRTFHYEIYTDMVFEDGDEFVDRDASKPNAWKVYGFEWKGDRLFLYNLDCDHSAGCIADRAHPITVLHRVKA